MAAPKFARSAGEYASQRLSVNESESKLRSRTIRKFQLSDLKVDCTIGKGTFCRIQRVRVKSPDLFEEVYALKCLNFQTKDSEITYKVGASDLALEGSILSRLHHENIVRLHGVSSGCISESFSNSDEGYFLVLDFLQDTLKDRLIRWRRETKTSRLTKQLKIKSYEVEDRLKKVALGVAKGMEYLHENKVVLQDLKPENVGFDEHGKIKIFDFGFARELHTCDVNEIAGSLSYMSPEKMSANPMGLVADVYSFGVLLWELCTLEKPFESFKSRGEMFQKVVLENWRPSLSSIRSKPICELISRCWDVNPHNRPTFTEIQAELQVIVSSPPKTSKESTHCCSLKIAPRLLLRSKSMNILKSLVQRDISGKFEVDNRLKSLVQRDSSGKLEDDNRLAGNPFAKDTARRTLAGMEYLNDDSFNSSAGTSASVGLLRMHSTT
jgi:serine/threonine protein kinase